jgi:hypothetical protein
MGDHEVECTPSACYNSLVLFLRWKGPDSISVVLFI